MSLPTTLLDERVLDRDTVNLVRTCILQSLAEAPDVVAWDDLDREIFTSLDNFLTWLDRVDHYRDRLEPERTSAWLDGRRTESEA